MWAHAYIPNTPDAEEEVLGIESHDLHSKFEDNLSMYNHCFLNKQNSLL